MIAPFVLPVRLDSGNYLVDKDHELVCRLEGATPQEAAYIKASVNHLHQFVYLAERLADWEKDPDHFDGDLADLGQLARQLIVTMREEIQ